MLMLMLAGVTASMPGMMQEYWPESSLPAPDRYRRDSREPSLPYSTLILTIRKLSQLYIYPKDLTHTVKFKMTL